MTQKAYIAGTGMITSIGGNTAMTAAAVKAKVSGYKASQFFNMQGYQITMASVPDEVFSSVDVEIETGELYCDQFDRIIKMAIIAIREAVSQQSIKKPIPLILALPELEQTEDYVPLELLLANLVNQKDLMLRAGEIQCVSTGRAAGIQGLELAIKTLFEKGEDYVLIGGSDSFEDAKRLYDLDETDRLLAQNRMDGFAVGEGACFILLTLQPELALKHNGHIISLALPGSSQEVGHYYSDKIYKGDGLDNAFKHALVDCAENSIDTIYSSMNGENHWAKEYGVATIRNKHFFKESVKTEHPADCFGDLGVATGTGLLGLSAESLLKDKNQKKQLVYSSSDGAWRSAVQVEKICM